MTTSPDFEFRLAAAQDDADIRALIGSVSMPGAVSIKFAREPDYFLGATIMGNPCDVLVVRHQPDGQLAGIAVRAEHRAFVNGQDTPLGYIGQIRVAPAYRGRWLVNQGAEWFREASPLDLLHFGVIASENSRAGQLLVGSHPPAGLHTRDVGGLTTCALLLRPSHPHPTPGVNVHTGSSEMLPEIIDFWHRQGVRRQFFPAYTLEDFSNGTCLRDLKAEDILIARRGSQIVGVLAVWDQAAYKQDVVESYGPTLRRLRPVYDLIARCIGARPLTPPGQAIQLAFAAGICILNDEPAVMQSLLSAAKIHAFQREKAFLMVGLSDDDPLLNVVRHHLHITYHSDLYAVSWSPETIRQLDERLPYIEIATL
ncbi:MAG: hypothetical protein JEZ00_11270 [Anaerolineaceae bacterium]|nr:hypothetical protein [Anaerolineaceae bacterium]